MSAQTEAPPTVPQQQQQGTVPVQLVFNVQLPKPGDANQALSMEEIQKQIAQQIAALTLNPQTAAAAAPETQTVGISQPAQEEQQLQDQVVPVVVQTPVAVQDEAPAENANVQDVAQPAVATPSDVETTSTAETAVAATETNAPESEEPSAATTAETTAETTEETAEETTEDTAEKTTEETTEETPAPEKIPRPPGDGPRKRALIVGINYIGTCSELAGCIPDAQSIRELLASVYGYHDENIRFLSDDQEDPNKIPTRSNILAGIEWLLDEAKANDTLFFYFSGHGTSVVDTDGDEVDGQDEAICPTDGDYAGNIIDDELNKLVVQGVPHGARLTAVFDSCHSGSVMDLPYMYSLEGKIQSESLLRAATKGLLSAGLSYMNGETEDVYSTFTSLGSKLINTRQIENKNRFTKSTKADVIMFSGCRDDQYSYEAFEENKHAGALTYAFIKSLKENPNPTYRQLMTSIREMLHIRYKQLPQFSASHEVDFDTIFAA